METNTQRKFVPACAATGIGSLPFDEIHTAVNFVKGFYHEIYFWPQLPQKNFEKNMIAEFFQKIPLTEIKNSFPRFVLPGDDPKLLSALRDFQIETQEEAGVLDLFGSGGGFFKTQITGPVTMLLNVSDAQGKNLFEFPKLVEWMKGYLMERAKSRARMITARGWKPIIFLDEPSLAQLEPLLLRSQRKFLVELLNSFVRELSKEGSLTGLHCCGRTDWNLVFEAGFDIVSFDAVKDIDHFLGEKKGVRNHFERGGVVAWGVVPSEYLGYELDCGKLAESFLEHLARFAQEPVSLKRVLLQSMVTTSCGTAGLGLEDNDKAHSWVREVSGILHGVLHETN